MIHSILIFTGLVLLGVRFFSSEKGRDKILALAVAFFLFFALAVHSWGANALPAGIKLLEFLTLQLTALWLVSDAVLTWGERHKERKKSLSLLRNGKGPLSEIIAASQMLAQNRKGALIAIEKKAPLEEWTHSGVPLDGKIRRETIFSVFTSPGALHDGGMIIRGDRIAACGVVFPLSKRLDLPTELGTRHRAALGLSEVTDALVLVVSEETGKISLADQGRLLYDVKPEKLPELLERLLRSRKLLRQQKKELRRPAGELQAEPAFRQAGLGLSVTPVRDLTSGGLQ